MSVPYGPSGKRKISSCPPLAQGKYRAAEVELSAPGEQAEISAIQKRTGHVSGGDVHSQSGGYFVMDGAGKKVSQSPACEMNDISYLTVLLGVVFFQYCAGIHCIYIFLYTYMRLSIYIYIYTHLQRL